MKDGLIQIKVDLEKLTAVVSIKIDAFRSSIKGAPSLVDPLGLTQLPSEMTFQLGKWDIRQPMPVYYVVSGGFQVGNYSYALTFNPPRNPMMKRMDLPQDGHLASVEIYNEKPDFVCDKAPCHELTETIQYAYAYAEGTKAASVTLSITYNKSQGPVVNRGVLLETMDDGQYYVKTVTDKDAAGKLIATSQFKYIPGPVIYCVKSPCPQPPMALVSISRTDANGQLLSTIQLNTAEKPELGVGAIITLADGKEERVAFSSLEDLLVQALKFETEKRDLEAKLVEYQHLVEDFITRVTAITEPIKHFQIGMTFEALTAELDRLGISGDERVRYERLWQVVDFYQRVMGPSNEPVPMPDWMPAFLAAENIPAMEAVFFPPVKDPASLTMEELRQLVSDIERDGLLDPAKYDDLLAQGAGKTQEILASFDRIKQEFQELKDRRFSLERAAVDAITQYLNVPAENLQKIDFKITGEGFSCITMVGAHCTIWTGDLRVEFQDASGAVRTYSGTIEKYEINGMGLPPRYVINLQDQDRAALEAKLVEYKRLTDDFLVRITAITEPIKHFQIGMTFEALTAELDRLGISGDERVRYERLWQVVDFYQRVMGPHPAPVVVPDWMEAFVAAENIPAMEAVFFPPVKDPASLTMDQLRQLVSDIERDGLLDPAKYDDLLAQGAGKTQEILASFERIKQELQELQDRPTPSPLIKMLRDVAGDQYDVNDWGTAVGVQYRWATPPSQGQLVNMYFDMDAAGNLNWVDAQYDSAQGFETRVLFEALSHREPVSRNSANQALVDMVRLNVVSVDDPETIHFSLKDAHGNSQYYKACLVDGIAKLVPENGMDVLRTAIMARIAAEIASVEAEIAGYEAGLPNLIAEWEAQVAQLKADLLAGRADADSIRLSLESYLSQANVSDALKSEIQAYLTQSGSLLEGLDAAGDRYAGTLRILAGVSGTEWAIRDANHYIAALKDHETKVSAAKTTTELELLRNLPPRMSSAWMPPPAEDPRMALNALLMEGKMLLEKLTPISRDVQQFAIDLGKALKEQGIPYIVGEPQRQADGTYNVSVMNPAETYKRGELVEMSFILDSEGHLILPELMSAVYHVYPGDFWSGNVAVWASLLFEAQGMCAEGEVCPQHVVSDMEKLVKMAALAVTQLDEATHFTLGNKYYKTYIEDGKVKKILEDGLEIMRNELITAAEADKANMISERENLNALLTQALEAIKNEETNLRAGVEDALAGRLNPMIAQLIALLEQTDLSADVRTKITSLLGEIDGYLAPSGSDGLSKKEQEIKNVVAYMVFNNYIGKSAYQISNELDAVNGQIHIIDNYLEQVKAAKTIEELEALGAYPRISIAIANPPPAPQSPIVTIDMFVYRGNKLVEEAIGLPKYIDLGNGSWFTFDPKTAKGVVYTATGEATPYKEVSLIQVYQSTCSPDGMCAAWSAMIKPSQGLVFIGSYSEQETFPDGSNQTREYVIYGKPDLGISPEAQQAINNLAGILRVSDADRANITVVRVEKQTWSNGCRGWELPGQMCTMEMVEGSIVTLALYGNEYEFHDNLLDPAKVAAIAAVNKVASDPIFVCVKAPCLSGANLPDIEIVSSVLAKSDPATGDYFFAVQLKIRNTGELRHFQVNYRTGEVSEFTYDDVTRTYVITEGATTQSFSYGADSMPNTADDVLLKMETINDAGDRIVKIFDSVGRITQMTNLTKNIVSVFTYDDVTRTYVITEGATTQSFSYGADNIPNTADDVLLRGEILNPDVPVEVQDTVSDMLQYLLDYGWQGNIGWNGDGWTISGNVMAMWPNGEVQEIVFDGAHADGRTFTAVFEYDETGTRVPSSKALVSVDVSQGFAALKTAVEEAPAGSTVEITGEGTITGEKMAVPADVTLSLGKAQLNIQELVFGVSPRSDASGNLVAMAPSGLEPVITIKDGGIIPLQRVTIDASSGFRALEAAAENAQPGTTITVTGEGTLSGDKLVIPDGVTFVLEEGARLNVGALTQGTPIAPIASGTSMTLTASDQSGVSVSQVSTISKIVKNTKRSKHEKKLKKSKIAELEESLMQKS